MNRGCHGDDEAAGLNLFAYAFFLFFSSGTSFVLGWISEIGRADGKGLGLLIGLCWLQFGWWNEVATGGDLVEVSLESLIAGLKATG
ncbi:hypothetical protein M0R45_035484 [Rubus argutus]|uniref:Uncharacterized protein n=1 Tax=Rubus argutus TaxID=59490 RepID=A0AAW1VXI3_RUBAR